MRVLITVFGTRGDIQPYVVLGRALLDRGHEPTLAVPEGFRDLVESAGLGFYPAGSSLLDLMQTVMPEASGPLDSFRSLGAMRAAMVEHLDEQLAAADAVHPELVVYHPKGLAGPHLAEAFKVPGVLSIPLPFHTPTQDFPVPFLARSLGRHGNRASYRFNRAGTLLYAGMINDLRRSLGLGKVGRLADPLRSPDGTPVHVLYPFSQYVVPVPPDYPATAHVTGYLFPPEDDHWQPDDRLTDFLQAGPPPVYVGFGSMGFGRGAEQRRDAVLSALRAAGARGILATGWGGLQAGEVPTDDVLVVDAVPHEWLFDRVSAVVHHGGAGTTAAGLRAGCPTLICPFLGDQPFWGARVHALGAGPAPIPAKQLAAGLTDRLRDLVREPGYRERAEAIGARIRSEDGLGNAVAVVEGVSAGR